MRLLVFILLTTSFAFPEPKTALVPRPFPWRQLTHASGMVFSGEVLDVRPAQNGNSATQISFRVENAMRGVRRGQIIRVSEWGGLWSSGERYLKGEHVLLFLYPKSKLGLTSPVGGRLGKYAVDSSGRVLAGDPQHGLRPLPLKLVKAQIARSVDE
jgi:hypothetical protein